MPGAPEGEKPRKLTFQKRFQLSLQLSFHRWKKHSALLRQYAWKYRRSISWGLGSLFIVDLVEILPPICLKYAVDGVLAHRELSFFIGLAVFYLAISLVQGLGRYGWRRFLIQASFYSGRDLRSRFSHHLFDLSASFFERARVGELLSHATTDTDVVRMALGPGLLTIADAVLYFLMVPAAMLWLSPKLTVLAFLPALLIPFFVLKREKRMHEQFQRVQESFSKLSAMSQELLNGIRVIKAFAVEDVQQEKIKKAGEEFIRLNLQLAKTQSTFSPMLDFLMSLGLVLLLFVGGFDVLEGTLALGTLVAFQRYIQKMAWPMTAVGLAITYFQRAFTSTERIQAVLSIRSDVPEPMQPKTPRVRNGKIEFKNLSFRFPGTEPLVLRNVSLTIEPGQRVAFLGGVGSGKTALLSLLPRMYPIGRGMLFIDDVDINDWDLETLRAQVGYVGQEVFLFSDSVVANVTLGINELKPEMLAARAMEASRLAAVHDDILNLLGAYGTRLGERGVNLSGGQKQRLTLARALIKDPHILVLDDALSSVDVQTERKILHALKARKTRNTELIAAHRISTVRDADWIVVLEKGEIRQMGKHDDLVADRRGLYRRIYEQQRLKEDLDQYAARPGI